VQVTQTPFNIGDYCAAMDRHEIIVNYDYQRSAKVWPPPARSFLIETILLGYPMPKLSLFQNTDVKSRKTIKEIVDGQQRSVAIHDFYQDKFSISRKTELATAAGRSYNQLDEDLQAKFLSYALSVDLFIGATKEDIREVFRRMNSYTVPLNPEEKRHAKYQGDFKWFIYRTSKKFDQTFRDIGTFTEKQLNRMQDAKLLADLIYAMLHGIRTTKATQLAQLYDKYDKGFAEGESVAAQIEEAMEYIVNWKPLHGTALMKPYQIYTLLLAIMHTLHPMNALKPNYPAKKHKIKDYIALANLTMLASVLDEEDPDPSFANFVKAGTATNVGEQRNVRFVWMCQALGPELI
jgi:hypothetical protein